MECGPRYHGYHHMLESLATSQLMDYQTKEGPSHNTEAINSLATRQLGTVEYGTVSDMINDFPNSRTPTRQMITTRSAQERCRANFHARARHTLFLSDRA
ncbi:hypothetical protein PoB_006347200 [Plakobranchus ocellatus]|uniref:Uncharacterized protein n=1 Tax=Plakobranchus ocellatus TaxID=259542 RepID=A0AAV4CYE5_9GAST|nr:hypothetical protein PoB_006347200 [Plakobranchus ocellatus]